MTQLTGSIRSNFAYHANYRDGPGASPFTARVAAALMETLDQDSSFGRRVIGWGGKGNDDAVALRCIGALHALARSGKAPNLAAVYPPSEADEAALGAAVDTAIAEHDAFLTAFLDRPPQTNETGRSALLLGAALMLAERFGKPLALYEIGASAGLNLRFVSYGYDLGIGRYGSPDAPLLIRADWRGNCPPLTTELAVASAAGCDITPLDPSSEADAARLIAYVWADQLDRLSRMEAAIANARRDDIRVEQADAADWVARHFGGEPTPGQTRLLYHTMVWSYLPEAARHRITEVMERAGSEATDEAPLAWFRFENDWEPRSARIDMRVWPGGEDRMIGRADFHGRWVEWA